jgi:ribosomal protein S27AE
MDSSRRKKNKSPASADACPVPRDKDTSGEHWRFCPKCGRELINEKCKLRCPRCHYFMSCSDFDFAG